MLFSSMFTFALDPTIATIVALLAPLPACDVGLLAVGANVHGGWAALLADIDWSVCELEGNLS